MFGAPYFASEFANTQLCELDKWTRHVFRQHPTIDDTLLKHKLLLMGIMLVKDIAPIEARQASTRRFLKILSAQTHTLDIADLDARWVFLQACNRSVDAAPGQGGKFKERARRSKVSRSQRQAKARKKTKRKAAPGKGVRKQGGAFRAFIWIRTLGARGPASFFGVGK